MEKIKHSVEYKKYRHDLALFFIGYVIIMAISAVVIFVMLRDNKDYCLKLFTIYAIGFSCVWLPFIIFYLVKFIKIFIKKDKYIYFKTELVETVNVFMGKQFIIDISFLHKNKKIINTSTFNKAAKYPSYDEFSGKSMLVGFNEMTNSVIIIDKNENTKLSN